ncbi:flavin reductase family protein [methane-oxidizing endosymbiont of Gigantopelta aegis]|uniref:flavin reductase family protein n=1 Tax=methane-oxidizing endosymbiont of Gigantopelta aegis TaxID=2794938 RepID=UPI0018DBECF5|nr:flavin reductase family protein [methane-oxidizing endosymbiont of Gigantopelta aegis]
MDKSIDQLVKTISHGVYVIGVKDDTRENAFTAAWVMQVSFDPVLLCISINPEHYSWDILQQGKICTVNVLGKQHYPLAEHFGTTGLKNKMAGFSWQKAQTGAPVLSESVSYFDCRVSHFCDAGDHKLAICKVVEAGLLNPGPVLLYSETDDLDGSSELYADKKQKNDGA